MRNNQKFFFNLFTFFREREVRNNHNSSVPIALPESFNTLMAQLKTLFLRGFPLSALYRRSWLSIYDRRRTETNSARSFAPGASLRESFSLSLQFFFFLSREIKANKIARRCLHRSHE